MSIESVMQIEAQLATEGKQPSVALIKARLPAPCPMPVVIQALQRWRSQQGGTATGDEDVPRTDVVVSNIDWPDNWIEAKASVWQRLQQQNDEINHLRSALAALQAELKAFKHPGDKQ